MADTFEIIAARPEQQLTPGGQLTEVMVADAVTIPHGVNFTVQVPKTHGWKEALIAKATAEAAELESLFSV